MKLLNPPITTVRPMLSLLKKTVNRQTLDSNFIKVMRNIVHDVYAWTPRIIINME